VSTPDEALLVPLPLPVLSPLLDWVRRGHDARGAAVTVSAANTRAANTLLWCYRGACSLWAPRSTGPQEWAHKNRWGRVRMEGRRLRRSLRRLLCGWLKRRRRRGRSVVPSSLLRSILQQVVYRSFP